MKYDHLVKFNGEYYPAGADVPVGNVDNKSESEQEKESQKRGRKPKEA